MSLIRRTQIENILGAISVNNSTTVPLSAGEVFTGEAEDVSGYKAIGIMIAASHYSATDGLSVEFSTNGINWHHIHKFTIPPCNGGDAPFYQLSIAAQYFRIVYTNGSTDLSFLRLQTIFHPTAMISETSRISDVINPQSNVVLNKTIIAGKNINNEFSNVGVNKEGRLKVSTIDTNEGNEYTLIDILTYTPGMTTKAIFYVPSGSEYNYHISFNINVSDNYEGHIYEDAEYSFIGIDWTGNIKNRDRSYSDDMDMKMYFFPTITASGSELVSFARGAGGGDISFSIANKPGQIILKPGKIYLWKSTNKSSNINYASTVYDFKKVLR